MNANYDHQEINNLLETETLYFQEVLQISQKILEQIQSLPLNVLKEMLSYRQQWIDKIQMLEKRRIQFQDDHDNSNLKSFITKISDISDTLVKIDNEINQNLQQRKMRYIEEISSITAKRNSHMHHSNALNDETTKIIDIKQG